ncbi:MAG: hypothetical protein HC781_07360 [Leptolyngbyaceae cyanobacterium CSU_1_4]|nr:hypothetical protein [Leptolyngbyaceae cyanobacterium CSU_1_4]
MAAGSRGALLQILALAIANAIALNRFQQNLEKEVMALVDCGASTVTFSTFGVAESRMNLPPKSPIRGQGGFI